MSIDACLGPNQESYSIDETFIDLAGVSEGLTAQSLKVRDRIFLWA